MSMANKLQSIIEADYCKLTLQATSKIRKNTFTNCSYINIALVVRSVVYQKGTKWS